MDIFAPTRAICTMCVLPFNSFFPPLYLRSPRLHRGQSTCQCFSRCALYLLCSSRWREWMLSTRCPCMLQSWSALSAVSASLPTICFITAMHTFTSRWAQQYQNPAVLFVGIDNVHCKSCVRMALKPYIYTHMEHLFYSSTVFSCPMVF